jgi:glycosyltransferase involved in cell wall biosynthesis
MLLIKSKTHEELIDYYNASDLCVFPSRVEGLPLVPREAMSCGTPSLVSDIPATKIFTPALRASLNPKSMNKKLGYFFNLSKKERNNLSKQSRKFIIKEFDDEVWKENYLKIILT